MPTAAPDELRERMVAEIAARDKIDLVKARAVLNALPISALVQLEMRLKDRVPEFQSDYDPYGR
jgi:hypothetical protein